MYNPPISIQQLVQHQIEERLEKEILTAVLNVGINVDKDELLRALQYDRNQYDEGYQDAMNSIVRCGECAHRRVTLSIMNNPAIACALTGFRVNIADYCSWGERREGE